LRVRNNVKEKGQDGEGEDSTVFGGKTSNWGEKVTSRDTGGKGEEGVESRRSRLIRIVKREV